MAVENDDFENMRCGYSEVNNNHRHYHNLRFATFALYFVVVGGLLYFSYGGGVKLNTLSWWTLIFWTKVTGLLFGIVFLGFDIYCERNLRHLRRAAGGLEESLGLSQFKTESPIAAPWGSYLVWVVYLSILIFWLFVQSSPSA